MLTFNRFLQIIPVWLAIVLDAMPGGLTGYAQTPRTGTSKHQIIVSRMTESEAFDGLDPKCPEDIRKRQRIVKVKYYSSDGKIHQGQLVIDAALKDDIKKVFALALKERFRSIPSFQFQTNVFVRTVGGMTNCRWRLITSPRSITEK